MADVILYFGSNADTMIATKALKDAGVAAKMIPKPANVSSPANLCLSVDGAAESQAVSALGAAGVALGGVAK
ncbi:MAG TPA: putative Se/S carrier-like protein [Candidatus Baltobacteraceae bacterium]